MQNTKTKTSECRYGDSCFKSDCVFSHPNRDPIVQQEASIKNGQLGGRIDRSTPINRPTQAPCKFGAKCTKPTCPYVHTNNGGTSVNQSPSIEMCRFGERCNNAACKYTHPHKLIPSLEQRPNRNLFTETGCPYSKKNDIATLESITISCPNPTNTSCCNMVSGTLPSISSFRPKPIFLQQDVCKYDGFCSRPTCRFTHIKQGAN